MKTLILTMSKTLPSITVMYSDSMSYRSKRVLRAYPKIILR